MNLEHVIKVVSDYTGVDIKSRRRDNDHVIARAIYYNISYNILKLGTRKRIAMAIGRNHATVIHSLNNVVPMMDKYYPIAYRNQRDIIDNLTLVENLNDCSTFKEMYESIAGEYKDLLSKYNEILKIDDHPEKKDMIESIINLPPNKSGILKIRLDAILKMI
ncbi:MAG: helix-turn-helix domain-containing protein [Methylophilaceae bacterium]